LIRHLVIRMEATTYEVRAYATPLRCFSLSDSERAQLCALASKYVEAVNASIASMWERVRWTIRWESRRLVSHRTWRSLPPEARAAIERRSWVKRLIPHLPSSKERVALERSLRGQLLENWSQSKHYVDAAIKDGRSILRSWQVNYLNGDRKPHKPLVRRRFVRVKKTMTCYDDGVLRVSIKPRCFIHFDLRRCWWLPRAREFLGHSAMGEEDLGEVLITEEQVVVTVRRRASPLLPDSPVVSWDNNLRSLDGFSPQWGFDSVSLKETYTIHTAYSDHRRRIQLIRDRRKRLYFRLVKKYWRRERNRVTNELHNIANTLVRRYQGHTFAFEDTKKTGMFSRSRKRNRDISRADWRTFASIIVYKTGGATVIMVPPHGTTKECPKCGAWNRVTRGATKITCSGCGLTRDRQKGAAFNIWVRAAGPSEEQRQQVVERWKQELSVSACGQ